MNSNQKRKTIAIDMDGVLANNELHYTNLYEKHYGVKVPREAILGKTELEAFPIKEAVRDFVLTPGFFRTLPVMDGAVEAVQTLMKNYNVYIVSAAMEFPLSLPEKYDWLKEHFPFISWENIIFCGDKSVINTDYLIDDHCKNLDVCSGKALMFTAFHNVNHNHHTRVNTWIEVVELFEAEESLV